MLNHAIWWSCLTLEFLLLAQGFRARLLPRYRTFYAYIAFVFLQDIICYLTFRPDLPNSALYAYTYWTTEFLCVVIGCGVVFEVYRVGLMPFPGTARMARRLLTIVFTLVLAKGVANVGADYRWWLEASTREIERLMRTTQAAAILVLVGLFLLYAIPFAKNLRGILLGYGLFVGVRVISLLFVPDRGQDFWSYLYSGSYLVALGIWLVSLWSYSENPVRQSSTHRLEIDYQRAAAATRRRLEAARGQLAKAVRP
jgi:hypothetical protein